MLAFRLLLVAVVIKLFDLTLSVCSVVACLNVDLPILKYSYQEDAGRTAHTDITRYLQVILCLIMSLSSLSCAIIILNWSVIFHVRRIIHKVVVTEAKQQTAV